MTTKATRDVLDMAIRPVRNFVLDGTGTSSIDSTPIGASVPDTGRFTNLTTGNLVVTTLANFTGATVIGLQSFYADLAECYAADLEYEPGTVVKIGGDAEITATTEYGDGDVFGVISTEPAMIMNQCHVDHGEGIHHLPVALVGRVPVRVVGPVTKGCRLVAMPGGVACAQTAPGIGVSFGRSLETSADTAERLIEVTIVTVK